MAVFTPLSFSALSNASYFSSNIAKPTSNTTDPTWAVISSSSSTMSKFYVCRKTSDLTHYLVFGGSMSTNTNCSNLIDTNTGSYTIFSFSQKSAEDFYDYFHIPRPSNLSSLGSNHDKTLAFKIDNNEVDFTNPIITSVNSNGKLNSSEWGYSATTVYASIRYNTDWFASSSGGSGGSGSESSSVDLSGLISAVILIPATIICVCLFKMIYNIFMNKKVRG